MTVVALDSDTLSELSRGNLKVVAHARAYLASYGRLTITSISVFERLRGYHAALAKGKLLGEHLRRFEAFVSTCVVLPLDARAANRAAEIWAGVSARTRRALGDVFIAAIASVNGLPLVTRNRRDFEPITQLRFVGLRLLDWTK